MKLQKKAVRLLLEEFWKADLLKVSDRVLKDLNPIDLSIGISLIVAEDGVIILRQERVNRNLHYLTNFSEDLLEEKNWNIYWHKIHPKISDELERDILKLKEKCKLRLILEEKE